MENLNVGLSAWGKEHVSPQASLNTILLCGCHLQTCEPVMFFELFNITIIIKTGLHRVDTTVFIHGASVPELTSASCTRSHQPQGDGLRCEEC